MRLSARCLRTTARHASKDEMKIIWCSLVRISIETPPDMIGI